ncbi:hypothetical protein PYW07_015479 [Mythimna separata]|uniref:Uncharacterized protein n=1 Tax=Mythimna separata TaxID=271217 RepID=A0AAD7YXE3_MYTSE|nr:hypothetical protein PYW07_015479 [Mythimna separata]
MKNKKKLKEVNITEDYSKEVLAKRKALQPQLMEERKKDPNNGNELTTSFKDSIEKDTPTQSKYEKFINILQIATKKDNPKSNKICSEETKQLLQKRKELIQIKENKINRCEIAEISKKINESIRKDKKQKRQNTLKKHIEKTGGIKKATKELNPKKDWLLKVKTKDGNCTYKRQEILKIATDYYQNLYQSKNLKKEIAERNITDIEQIPKILKEETIRAIHTQK